jgi:ABC-type bacteriocin/lantibiotic exporter with double-glycine peptidase domain
MKVVYTEAAEQELHRFHDQQKEMLEKLVAEKKVVFGDDVLEITASDIKEASRNIRPLRSNIVRYGNVQILTRLYVLIGILMMLGAIYYREIEDFIYGNKTRGMLFLMGALLSMIGIAANYLYMLRKRRFLDAEQRMLERLSGKD